MLLRNWRHQQAGFTLIELLVVTTLAVLLLLTITSLFMTFLLSNSKSNIRKVVSTEGNYAMRQMEFLLRNATKLVPNSNGQTCTTGMESIAFESIDGGQTELVALEDVDDPQGEDTGVAPIKVASVSASNRFLTSRDVTVVGDQITFDCTTSGYSTIVEIQFTLTKSDIDSFSTETFNSRVSLRN